MTDPRWKPDELRQVRRIEIAAGVTAVFLMILLSAFIFLYRV